MTVMLMESFTQQMNDLITYGKWWSYSQNSYWSRGVGRVPGSYALYSDPRYSNINDPGYWYATYNMQVNTQRVTVGFAFMDRGSPTTDVLWFDDVAFTTQITIRIDYNLRTIAVWRGNDATLLFTFSLPYFVNRWHYMELAFFIDPAVGWAEGRLDGQAAGGYYGTGTNRATANGNTRQSATNSHVRFMNLGNRNMTPGGMFGRATFSDLVLMNGATQSANQPNNDFMGDVRVMSLLTTGPGAHTDFTPGGTAPAATNWQSVNKDPVPGDATYVQANTVGAQDTYALADLPNTIIAVKAVQVGVIARKTDAGVRFLAPLVRWAAGGPLDVPVPVGGIGLQNSFGYLGPQVLETRPDGQPWTVADINALEVGERIIQ